MYSNAMRSTESVPYQRFKEVITVSVTGQVAMAALYGLVLGQPAIGWMLFSTTPLVLALFPLLNARLSLGAIRLLNHLVLVATISTLNISLMWMGWSPRESIWWMVWWPIYATHLMGVWDGAIWLLIVMAATALQWANAQHHWVTPLMTPDQHPMFLLQLSFLVVGAAFGMVVRRAHEGFERTIANQQAQLTHRARELADALDAVQQSSLQRTQMFAQLSHELRTPLNGVMGFAQLLERTELSSEQQAHVSRIKVCGESMLHIANGVLDFSRLEAQSAELEARAYDAVVLMNEVVGMLEPLAGQKGLALNTRADGEALPVVGDALRVRQILINLLANAVKFTERGEVIVSCRQLAHDDGSPRLRFEVADSGIGIAPDALPYLFEPFSPVSERTIRTHGGSGLGLAICKRLVDIMQGDIGVHSVPGQGSVFWFHLPLQPQAIQP